MKKIIKNKLYVNELCVGLHSKCNWDCTYCIAKKPNAIIDEDEIFEQLIPIKNRLNKIFLSGGEPGLLSENFLERLTNLTNHKLGICTNGTFVHKNYHIKFEKNIRSILIHCVPELDEDIHPKILEMADKIFPFTVDYTIVIHDKNSHLLEAFLKKYHHIHFSLCLTDETFYSYPYPTPELFYDFPIKEKTALELIKIFSKCSGYSDFSDLLVKAILKKNFKYLNMWSDKNHN